MVSENPPLNLYKKIVFSFIAFTLILVFLILYLSFSNAKIIITPTKEVASADFIIDIIENPETEGVLQGKIIEVVVDGNENFTLSGGQEVDAVASGKVTIFNKYNKNQPLVKTTRLLTPDGLLFRLEKTVNVPAGGEVEVEVYADEAGKKYEIGATKFTIPGLWEGLQDKIYASSFEKMTGGTKQIKVISDNDIAKGEKEIKEKLYAEGLVKLEEELQAGEGINKNLTFKEVLESSTDAVAGEETAEFGIDMKLKVIALIIDEEQLLSLAETKMKNSISADKKLVSINNNSLNYTLEKYDMESKMVNLKVYLEGETVLKDTSLIFNKDKLIGRTKSETEAYLKSFDAIEEAVVRFSPFWVTKVPSLKDHIKIEIK